MSELDRVIHELARLRILMILSSKSGLDRNRAVFNDK